MKKFSVMLASLMLIIVLIVPTATASTPEPQYVKMEPVKLDTLPQGPEIEINGKTVDTTYQVLKDGTTYVPIGFFTNLGLTPVDINRPIIVNDNKNNGNVSYIVDNAGNVATFCKFKRPGQKKTFFLVDTGKSIQTYCKLRETAEFFGASVIFKDGKVLIQ